MSVSIDRFYLTTSRIITLDDPADKDPLRYGTGFFYSMIREIYS